MSARRLRLFLDGDFAVFIVSAWDLLSCFLLPLAPLWEKYLWLICVHFIDVLTIYSWWLCNVTPLKHYINCNISIWLPLWYTPHDTGIHFPINGHLSLLLSRNLTARLRVLKSFASSESDKFRKQIFILRFNRYVRKHPELIMALLMENIFPLGPTQNTHLATF